MKCVAFIPARAGSKRIADKNIRELNGHPLIDYSISAALESKVFDAVICATDSEEYAEIARKYGAEVPFLRDASISGDKSPDIEWVTWMLMRLNEIGRSYDVFSILRPTSPFRTSETIQRAWNMFISDEAADSLRAVEKCKQHPGKMWMLKGHRMLPLLPFTNEDTPWHSSQYASLPEVYIQNASLEIAWTRIPIERKSIAGESIIPLVSVANEGFDINELEDWWVAEKLIANDQVILPIIDTILYQ